jgi:nicotinate-nucleotide--dimethylbenzimidazole phosphoribosyltransferase
VTGRGAGLSDEGLRRKIDAIRRALAVNRPDPRDGLDVLSKVGGLDIAGMCGTFLGGAIHRVPILVDGFISAVAALCALRIAPGSRHAMLAAHVSAEPAARLVLEALGLQPLISAGLRLGEGTGAVAAMPLLDMALAVYDGMVTFDNIGMEAYEVDLK